MLNRSFDSRSGEYYSTEPSTKNTAAILFAFSRRRAGAMPRGRGGGGWATTPSANYLQTPPVPAFERRDKKHGSFELTNSPDSETGLEARSGGGEYSG